MGYKTVSLNEKAYEALLRHKKPGESFSDVIIRLTSRLSSKDLMQFAGALKKEGVDKEELQKFKEACGEMWEDKD